jgi:hypothetical protein
LRIWPAEERLLSPILAAIFVPPVALAVLAVAVGKPLLVVGAISSLAGVAAWGEGFAWKPIERLEEWYAKSSFVTRRLLWRSHRRRLLPAARPTIERICRFALLASALAVSATVIAAAAGMLPPVQDAPLWMRVVRVVTKAFGYVATTSLVSAVFLKREIRSWDRQSASPLRASPVVSSVDVFRALDRPTPRFVARWVAFIAVLVLLYAQL